MSDGSPVSPQLDARMLADLREWRERIGAGVHAGRWSMRLTIDELDMLLRRVDDLETLKREMCADIAERTVDDPRRICRHCGTRIKPTPAVGVFEHVASASIVGLHPAEPSA
jgi:hypothetical protein